jgi:transmembrane sensor
MCNDRIWILLTRKLSGEATQTELDELSLLVDTIPQGSATVEKITDIWQSSPTHDADFMEATYLAHLERIKEYGVELSGNEPVLEAETLTENTGSRRWFSFKGIAVVVFATLLLSTLWFTLSSRSASDKGPGKEELSEVKTTRGARSKIKLPDGSDVWLNAGSKLNYNKDFETGKREVFLTGEAFFDVVHDAGRPFFIHTAAINIKVLGTQFNVKAYEEDVTTETSLLRGSVEVWLAADTAKKYILKPNEKLVLSNKVLTVNTNEKMARGPNIVFTPEIKNVSFLPDDAKTNIESSWTRNILSFEDELFSEVAKKMERWYDVTVVFKNKRWENEFMSGAFENESLEQAMKALKFSTRFNYTIEGKTITIQ